MVTAIILAGGTGSRMASDIPKQYLMVSGVPVISYCLDTFEKHSLIDKIVIVVSEEWKSFISEWIEKKNIKKFCGFADAGKSRQHSIFNGLKLVKELESKDDDIVIIHDAVRPSVSERIISDCINILKDADGSMPVVAVKDTIYASADAERIDGLLNRDQLFAGQAPEAFIFGKYFDVNDKLTDEEMGAVRGSSEIAYKSGLKVKLVSGCETNFKITTKRDFEEFRSIIGARKNESL